MKNEDNVVRCSENLSINCDKIKEFYFDFPDLEDYYAARSELGLTSYAYTLNPKLNGLKENLNNYANVNGIEIESASGYWYDDINGDIINKEEIDINKLIDEAKEMSNKGMSNKEIVALLVDKYGLKKNFLYDLVCKNV